MGGVDRARILEAAPAMSAGKVLFELQVEQHHHDETYHREIARLPMHQRLNHMALHFSKYAGKIAIAPDTDTILRVLTDTLIIAISTANILNTNLWELVEPQGREFLGLSAFGRSIAAGTERGNEDRAQLLREFVIAAGLMAAACEKIDHLEEVNFRHEARESITQLSRVSIAFMALNGVDPAASVRERLSDVKTRLRLHGRI